MTEWSLGSISVHLSGKGGIQDSFMEIGDYVCRFYES